MSTAGDDPTTTPPSGGIMTAVPDEVEAYLAAKAGADFVRLRTRFRRYVATMAALFLGVFTATVVTAGWAPDAFGAQLSGNVTVGMLLAAGLICLPATVSVVHLLYTNRRLDPLADRIRAEFERSRQ
jgi:uncharacterized membrane protein (DUF485 family)